LTTRVAGGSTFTIDGTLTNSAQAYIGNPTQTASTTITAADLDNTGLIDLDGGSNSGTLDQVLLDITGAGTLDGSLTLSGDSLAEFGGGLDIGNTDQGSVDVGSGSTLEVTGALDVGNGAFGLVTVTDGGSVDVDGSGVAVADVGFISTGSVDVTGAGASFAVTGDNNDGLIIGDDSDGVFDVEDGASVSASSDDADPFYAVVLGNQADGAGTLTVDGSGSSFTAGSGGLAVGLVGTGYVTVSEGATLTVDGSKSLLGIGAASTVDVTGPGSELTLGTGVGLNINSTGSLMVDAGGSVSIVDELVIGASGSGTGSVDVDGGFVTDDGLLNVGGAETGALSIEGGGTVSVGYELILGDNSSAPTEGSGTITQTGGLLQIDSGGTFYLSDYGNGEYDLDGGTLEIGGDSLFANDDDGTGTFNLGGGTIAVTGSELTTDANITLTADTTSVLNVGTLGADFTGKVSGSGNLDITGSGVASFADLSTTGDVDLDDATLNIGSTLATVGQLDGTGGTVEIGTNGALVEGDGTDSTFSGAITGTNFNTDTVAKVGSDTLTLNNVTATGVQILAYQGNVAITGTDSLSYLAIGEGPGTATASIGDGASLTINGINGAGHAGALQVGDFGGTGTFDQTGGTVTITGNNALNVGNQGGTGTYDLEGGQLVLGAIDDIGRNTPTTSDPNGTPASHGTIYISGTGVLEVASGGELILGSDASTTVGESSGTITQTGGTLEIDSGGALYLSAYGNGEYDLDGGTLELGGSSSLFANYNDHGGTGTFKLGGGTIAVTGSELTTDADITLTSGTTSTLNVGTLGADFTGKVSGAGNLDITGSGGGELCGPVDDGRSRSRWRDARYRLAVLERRRVERRRGGQWRSDDWFGRGGHAR
jgi:T5SS/PEP-CTERM-associated repeat protein